MRATHPRRSMAGMEAVLADHKRLAWSVARFYTPQPQYTGDDREDLAIELMLTMAKAYEKWRPGRARFTTFVHPWLHRDARRWQSANRSIPAPDAAVRQARKDGKQLPIAVNGVEGDLTQAMEFGSMGSAHSVDGPEVSLVDACGVSSAMRQARLTEQEAAVVQGLMDGHSQADMAVIMGVSKQRVAQVLKSARTKMVPHVNRG